MTDYRDPVEGLGLLEEATRLFCIDMADQLEALQAALSAEGMIGPEGKFTIEAANLVADTTAAITMRCASDIMVLNMGLRIREQIPQQVFAMAATSGDPETLIRIVQELTIVIQDAVTDATRSYQARKAARAAAES